MAEPASVQTSATSTTLSCLARTDDAYLGGGAMSALMMPRPSALFPSLVALKASTASENL